MLPIPPPTELRSLVRDDFVQLVGTVLTQFTATEIEQWFHRIDADDQKSVSWSDFSTFLLSRAQYLQQTDSRGAEYGAHCRPEVPPPVGCIHQDSITKMLIYPKLNRIFTGSRDGTVRTWSADSLEYQRFVMNTESWVTAMCLIRNGTRLLVASADRAVTVLDARSCEIVRTYEGRGVKGQKGASYIENTSEVVERKLCPTVRNDKAALGLAPGRVKIDPTTVMRPQQFPMGPASPGASSSTLTPRQSQFDATKRIELGILADLCDTPNDVISLGVKGNEDSVCFACRDGAVKFYSLSSMAKRIVYPTDSWSPHGLFSVNQIRTSTYLAGMISCSDDQTLKITDFQSGSVVRSFAERGHQRAVHGFAWSDSIKVLASYSPERTVMLWDRMQPSPINRIASLSAPACAVALNESAHQLVVHTLDNVVRVFDLRTNTQLQILTEHDVPRDQGIFTSMSMDGTRIVLGSTYPVAYLTRRELGSGQTVQYCGHLHPAAYFAFNAQANTIVSVDNESAYTWNVATGAPIFLFSVTSFRKNLLEDMRLTSINSDVSCRRLVTGFHRGVVVIWNMSNGQALAQLQDERFVGQSVTAVLTATRQNTTFYVIATGSTVVCCQSSTHQYSISIRDMCKLPAICGRVVSLVQVNENTVACGTTSAAIIFLNLLTMQVEGDPLLPPVGSSDLHRRMSSMLMIRRDATMLPSAAAHVHDDAEERMAEKSGLRCETMHMIEGVSNEPHLLACYTNGQVILWNTTWRTAATVTSVATIAGYPTAYSVFVPPMPANVPLGSFVEARDVAFVFGDDSGHVYVVRGRVQTNCYDPKSPTGTTDQRSPTTATPADVELLLCQTTFVAEVAKNSAILTLHAFAIAGSESANDEILPTLVAPSAPLTLWFSVSCVQVLEAKFGRLTVPEWADKPLPAGHSRRRFHDTDPKAVIIGTLGTDRWTHIDEVFDEECNRETLPVYYDSIDTISDIVAPKAAVAGKNRRKSAPPVTAPVTDPRNIAELMELLNARAQSRASDEEDAISRPVQLAPEQLMMEGTFSALSPLSATSSRQIHREYAWQTIPPTSVSILIPTRQTTAGTAPSSPVHRPPLPPAQSPRGVPRVRLPGRSHDHAAASLSFATSMTARPIASREGIVKQIAHYRVPRVVLVDADCESEDSDDAMQSVTPTSKALTARAKDTLPVLFPMSLDSTTRSAVVQFNRTVTLSGVVSPGTPSTAQASIRDLGELSLNSPNSQTSHQTPLSLVQDYAARQERRLLESTRSNAVPLHRRVRAIEGRLRREPRVGVDVSAAVNVELDWTVRASARLPPQSIGSYENADVLLNVLQEKNPAVASRAMGPSSRPGLLGALHRSRPTTSPIDHLPPPMPPVRAPILPSALSSRSSSRAQFDSSTGL
jgi:WD40 repeat protein